MNTANRLDMKIITTSFEGLYVLQTINHQDNRGGFQKLFNSEIFQSLGLSVDFSEMYYSVNKKDVLRGMHFQKHHPQGKLVRCVSGKVYDVAVDLRKDSPTFGQYYGVILDSEKQNQFYVPQGFAHGFLVLTESAIFAYKCTDFYHPEDEGGLMWNDATIGIDWFTVAPDLSPLLSDKDTKHPAFSFENNYFDENGVWIE